MRAWQALAQGEPEKVLSLAEIPVPEPGPGQMLVRVRAAALNFPDVLLCRGDYQIRPELPFTPGVELCGEVTAVGDGVDPGRVGSRVIGNPVLPHGALADFTLMHTAEAFDAPESLDDAEAAALHIAYQTAWFALHRRAGLKPGETVLVHAAAGGVGSATVQLAKAAGARVIGVVGGPEKAQVARELGADLVVDRTTEDFVGAVKEATGGRGADVVFDPVGGAAFAGSTKCIAFEGRIVVVGFAGGTVPAPPLNHALVKNYSILGLHWGLYKLRDPASIVAAHEELCALADQGVVKPLISERVGLERAPEALAALGAGSTTGRVAVLLG
ncbi:NADPH:quinone oxidoreductase family protein [Actinospica robiniae]|uniref:Zn-dependent oxidoreductase, NADPH:quinone reductase n=1 Tax=Actinospica robiniae DSM 44927 TaxID=479430 RepID=W9E4B7_9ACTN|nr:NADPH:quinone oxidoreductase family protein [Actinospica robiniae]ETA70992.1 Zn-dependent oxidoreductase, NADPH:quinone reductase [Actinospica robiniae DSM 44927]